MGWNLAPIAHEVVWEIITMVSTFNTVEMLTAIRTNHQHKSAHHNHHSFPPSCLFFVWSPPNGSLHRCHSYSYSPFTYHHYHTCYHIQVRHNLHHNHIFPQTIITIITVKIVAPSILSIFLKQNKKSVPSSFPYANIPAEGWPRPHYPPAPPGSPGPSGPPRAPGLPGLFGLRLSFVPSGPGLFSSARVNPPSTRNWFLRGCHGVRAGVTGGHFASVRSNLNLPKKVSYKWRFFLIEWGGAPTLRTPTPSS